MALRPTREEYLISHANPLLATLETGIEENNPERILRCINCGADVNALTPTNGVKPLDLALQKCSVLVIRLLLEGGASAKGRDTQGSTTLINASKYGYLECVKLLVEHGANLYACDVDGKTCLHAALEQKRHSVAAYLLRKDACKRRAMPTDSVCLMRCLILTDDASSISNLRRCEVDLDTPCPDGTLPVFFALKHCKNNSLKGLLQGGSNPNLRNADGNLALHEAMEHDNTDAVKHLMLHGADSQMVDKDGLTVIDVAVNGQCLPMLRLLLDWGANIEQKCTGGSTPLLATCAIGYMEGVQLLIERGANLNVRSASGQTCLLVALEHEHQSIAHYLLDQEICEVNGIDRNGLSALHHAVHLNSAEMMRKLIEKQVNVNIQNLNGEMPVFTAVKRGALNLLRMLLEAGADPNIDTENGDFALHGAVKHGDVQAMKLLLQHGADRERLDKNGMTPVEIALALVPPPQDIIHCLLNDYIDSQDLEMFPSTESHVKANKKILGAEAEQSLCCPITFEIMKHPVIAMDGHTYEREAIKKWILEKKESPVTRQPLTSEILIPNLAIKHLIDQFADSDSNP